MDANNKAVPVVDTPVIPIADTNAPAVPIAVVETPAIPVPEAAIAPAPTPVAPSSSPPKPSPVTAAVKAIVDSKQGDGKTTPNKDIPPKEFIATIKMVNGTTWDVPMKTGETMLVLKKRLEQQAKAPPMESMRFVARGKTLDDPVIVEDILTIRIEVPASATVPPTTISIRPNDSLESVNEQMKAAGVTPLNAKPNLMPIFVVVNAESAAKHEKDRAARVEATKAEERQVALRKAEEVREAKRIAELAELARRAEPAWLVEQIAAATRSITSAKDPDALISALCAEAKRLRLPVPLVSSSAPAGGKVPSTSRPTWTCSACAKHHSHASNFCSECGNPAPPTAKPSGKSYAAAAGGSESGAAAVVGSANSSSASSAGNGASKRRTERRPPPSAALPWACGACTYENSGGVRCAMCSNNNPNAAVSQYIPVSLGARLGGGGGGGGGNGVASYQVADLGAAGNGPPAMRGSFQQVMSYVANSLQRAGGPQALLQDVLDDPSLRAAIGGDADAEEHEHDPQIDHGNGADESEDDEPRPPHPQG
jgi:hypothetical protein